MCVYMYVCGTVVETPMIPSLSLSLQINLIVYSDNMYIRELVAVVVVVGIVVVDVIGNGEVIAVEKKSTLDTISLSPVTSTLFEVEKEVEKEVIEEYNCSSSPLSTAACTLTVNAATSTSLLQLYAKGCRCTTRLMMSPTLIPLLLLVLLLLVLVDGFRAASYKHKHKYNILSHTHNDSARKHT